MSGSRNRWSFDDKIFGVGFMSLNDDKLKQFDVSKSSLLYLALILRKGMLDKIKSLFSELNDNQKEGLLTLLIDYDQVDNDYFNFGQIFCGNAIDLANQFGHLEINKFLVEQNASLTAKESKSCIDSKATASSPSLFRSKEVQQGNALEEKDIAEVTRKPF